LSHVSAYQTQVVFQHVRGGGELEDDPAWPILQEAVSACAEARGGRTGSSVADVFGRAVACDVALSLPDFRPGIGLRVDRETGELRFLYDAYGRPPESLRAVTDEILQNFTSIAVARALRELRYEVDLEEHGEGADRRVVVRGVL
jgi:hypothetical protein